MTPNDPETVVDELAAALRNDAGAAPASVRKRILARVEDSSLLEERESRSHRRAPAGSPRSSDRALPSATSAAAGAAIATTLVKVAAAHPAATLVTTFALLASIGLGTHAALVPEVAPGAASSAAAHPRAPEPKHTRESPRANPPRAIEAPSASSAAPVPEPEKPAAPPTRPLIWPGPDLPAADAGVPLKEQQALLDQARAELRRGDGRSALAAIAGHRALFPTTAFAEEREAIEALALSMSGRNDEARERAGEFAARYPQSLFLPSIRSSVGERDGTEPNAPKNE